ncbi:ABC transporter ATP-binding protein [Ramlibacter sp. PS4R-6]|uniref:ABC transporter ATP-binding protein n=1 Tax=Ramlibacter sp. PS4R-6 TaxID=3133438 RepID=UPI0030B710F4
MSRLVELRGASVRYGPVTALESVDLAIAGGERVAVIGGNGSGKSTLLRALHGLLVPQSGSVKRDARSREAMVFQRPYLLRTSALDNIALALRIRGGWSRREAHERALLALGRVGLSAQSTRNARALSAGQQQRLALARAWATKPDVLFLDEPTSNLDPHGKREVESLMAEFADGGMTLVFASHNLGQVKRLATRVIYLEQGRLLADLPVQQFFDHEVLGRTSPDAQLFVKGESA